MNRFKGKNTEVCICLLHTKAGVQELILNQVCQFKVFFYCCLCIMVELIEYLNDSVIAFGHGSNEIVASTIYFRSLDLAYGYWLISRPVSKRRFALKKFFLKKPKKKKQQKTCDSNSIT